MQRPARGRKLFGMDAAPDRLMTAVLLTGHGGFECLLYRTDVPRPVAAAGEVLIRVGAAAINNTDINTRIGWYTSTVRDATGDSPSPDAPLEQARAWTGDAQQFPRIQGADVCGCIIATGRG